ncbi:transcription termination/antitermination protein NusA [bacterium]|uniref:transcription termination factor NusA n=1 Tax=Candidatus Ventrenecus sp. TaxID=3085654 RepID=UPI001D76483E|nr:transcription termination/antitermination protein NusA [bacterium]
MNSKEFIKALDNIILEKGISKDVVYDAMELALATAYKKNFGSKTNVKVKIDRNTGDIRVLSYYVVVDDYDDGVDSVDEEGNAIHIPPEINPDAQILLEEAREIDPTIEIGETIEKEVTPKDFGRVAASTAKQVLTQKIREAERENIMAEFHDKQGEMMMGLLAMEDQKNYYVDLGKSRGIMAKSEIIPGETLKMGTNVRVYITKVEETPKGPLILCSRKHYGFVKRLFETEIPELVDGTIELYSVIREPGVRSKVAVYSNDEKVDPVGACIGERGSRIASILKELNGEKVDLVRYSDDAATFIANALAPAKDVTVNIIDPVKREALAIVNDENLSLAIGRKGTNIKLASRLTKYKIEVKTLRQINEEGNK